MYATESKAANVSYTAAALLLCPSLQSSESKRSLEDPATRDQAVDVLLNKACCTSTTCDIYTFAL